MNSDSNPEIIVLRNQLFTLLVALIVVSGTVTTYLYRQASMLGKDIDGTKQQYAQLFKEYTQNRELIGTFESQLLAYGKTHPDFQPILIKYQLMAPPSVAPVTPMAPSK